MAHMAFRAAAAPDPFIALPRPYPVPVPAKVPLSSLDRFPSALTASLLVGLLQQASHLASVRGGERLPDRIPIRRACPQRVRKKLLDMIAVQNEHALGDVLTPPPDPRCPVSGDKDRLDILQLVVPVQVTPDRFPQPLRVALIQTPEVVGPDQLHASTSPAPSPFVDVHQPRLPVCSPLIRHMVLIRLDVEVPHPTLGGRHRRPALRDLRLTQRLHHRLSRHVPCLLRPPLPALAVRLIHGHFHQLRFHPVFHPLVGCHTYRCIGQVRIPLARTMPKVRPPVTQHPERGENLLLITPAGHNPPRPRLLLFPQALIDRLDYRLQHVPGETVQLLAQPLLELLVAHLELQVSYHMLHQLQVPLPQTLNQFFHGRPHLLSTPVLVHSGTVRSPFFPASPISCATVRLHHHPLS